MNIDHVQTGPKGDLLELISSLTPVRLRQIGQAIVFALELDGQA